MIGFQDGMSGVLLTDRERRVVREIVSGKGPTAIAQALGVTVKTYSTYRMRILEKLRLANNGELITYAAKNGLG